MEVFSFKLLYHCNMNNTETLNETIALRLKALIEKKQVKLCIVAKETGISQNTVNRFLKCKQMPRLRHILLLVGYFKCTVNYLLGLD